MGGRHALVATLVAILGAQIAAAAHEGETVPVVASVEMDGPGYAVWTIELTGTTTGQTQTRMGMHGVFGEVAMKWFTADWAPLGGSAAFAYAKYPTSHTVVGPVALLPARGTMDVATGGGMTWHPATPETRILRVVAFAASTGEVTSWSASLRMDNATLVAASEHRGGTFAATSRAPPAQYESGIVGAPPPQPTPSAPSGETARLVEGELVGDFLASRRDGQQPDLTLTTPMRKLACPCALESAWDGRGEYVFAYAGTERGDAYLAGIEAPLRS